MQEPLGQSYAVGRCGTFVGLCGTFEMKGRNEEYNGTSQIREEEEEQRSLGRKSTYVLKSIDLSTRTSKAEERGGKKQIN